MGSKRKRALESFDFNKSDSEDENFDPSEARVASRSSKKSRPSRASRPSGGRRKGARYAGSDIDDDEEIFSDSFEENSYPEDASEEENAPVNAAGRRTRKAARTQHNYRESSADEDADEIIIDDSDGAKEDEHDVEESEGHRKLVKLKVPKASVEGAPRRATRANTADADDFVELSNSGRHAVPSYESHSRSPEPSRPRRPSRSAKTAVAAPETIEEATQESSSHVAHDPDNPDDPDELSHDYKVIEKKEAVEQKGVDVLEEDDIIEPAKLAEEDKAAAAANDEDDDDDDDVPLTRRTRASRSGVTHEDKAAEETADDAAATTRRLTRGRSKKSTQEPSSDFEPGDESEDEVMSQNKADDVESPTPRGRSNRRSARNSRRGGDSADDDLDIDELDEEARELRQSSRQRRRPRTESPIVYQESRRARTRVNYYMPPLTAANIEEEEVEDPAPTPARRRKGGATLGWERNLNTTFGPFGGGGGGGSLLGGPWGTGAAGGVDSDSSDDEMVHRSSVAGNIGMTPTSAAPTGGLLPGPLGLNAEATPNVGKIKDRKALADADPLGVDMNVDFSQVGGLQGHIDQLKEMVQLPLLYPELFAKFHVTPPRGVLFHGPPGTGKTLLARALANSIGSGGRKISFYMRKGADALSKWVGEAEKQLRLLFEEARKTQPSIIFFDEIDGLAPVRSSKQEQIHASIVSTLLALMDGMDGRGQVIVIGATNRPDNIDPALRRPGRFDREFYFPLPDIDGRRSILNIHTKDWGLSPKFMTSLAEKTKGYGGADLRALCTEAALNSIQRTYPQIYSSTEKLVVDANKISVHASDFMISIKKLIPSSERSATSGAKPLPKSVEPLLRTRLSDAKRLLDDLLPRKKKTTSLEEALYEQYDDEDHGFAREAMQQEFERSRVFRPRFLIFGSQGMGQAYLAPAILHYLEGVHIQNFDLPALLADGRAMEQVIVGLFTEIRRHRPSVIYIPNVEAWYATLVGSIALVTFQTMLRSIAPTDPVLVLATAESDKSSLPSGLLRDLFGFSQKNRMELTRPERENRMEYFSATLDYIKKKPAEFPDPENRKKRVLEDLSVAPTVSPKPPTKEEAKAQKRKDHQTLNALKVQLQPIMDQINRKYKKFRQPVIPQNHIDYLFAESDPNFVRPDISEGLVRPYEIVKDKYGHDVLRDTVTGKCFYNLETTTIEERLSNGFYARPKDFLFDIKALAKDARNIGDKERTLKANELLSNVEVDVASIETTSAHAHIDWEGLHRRQVQRAAQAAEKERKRKAMQSVLERVQSDLGGANDSDSQGPLTLGEAVPGSRTSARFQLRSPTGRARNEQETEHAGNGAAAAAAANSFVLGGVPKDHGDVQMTDVEGQTAATQGSAMGPPTKSEDGSVANEYAGPTQISQRSAVTSLPPGVSPSAVVNDASSTKTSDPSTHRSSNFSTQLTNGNHRTAQGAGNDLDADLPDTLKTPSQASPSDYWPHSQARGLARGGGGREGAAEGGNLTSSPFSLQSQARQSSGHTGAGPSQDADSTRYPGSSSSQPLSVEGAIENLLGRLTEGTSGCTIEQLEQINRELMDEIWRSRHEWNRHKVIGNLSKVFNDVIRDIEFMQGVGALSQSREEL